MPLGAHEVDDEPWLPGRRAGLAGGRIFLGATQGLAVVDAATGAVTWPASGAPEGGGHDPGARSSGGEGESLWAIETQWEGAESLAVGGDRTPGSPRRVRAEDLVPGGRLDGPPALDGQRLVVPVADGTGSRFLCLLEGGDLSLAGKVELPWAPSLPQARADSLPRRSTLAVAGGTAWWVAATGLVAAIDLLEGRPRWVTSYRISRGWQLVNGWLPTPPVRWGTRLLVAPVDGLDLLCLDAATGREIWSQPRESQSMLLGAGGGLVFTGGRGVIARRIDDHGIIEWERPDVVVLGRPVLTDREMIVSGLREDVAGVYRIDLAGGRLLRFDPVAPTPGDLIAAGDDLLVSTGPDWVIALGFAGKDEPSLPLAPETEPSGIEHGSAEVESGPTSARESVRALLSERWAVPVVVVLSAMFVCGIGHLMTRRKSR